MTKFLFGKGNKFGNRFKKGYTPWNVGISPWNKGKKMSAETRKKMSIATKNRPKDFYKNKKGSFQKGSQVNLGRKHSLERRMNESLSQKGRVLSKETKEKMRQIHKNKYMTDTKTREKIQKWREKNLGEGNFNWRGGISFEPYSVDWTITLRKSIRQRDKYTCQICGKEPANSVHHIDYNKKNCNPTNLITLCRKCHCRTSYERSCWTNYLSYKIENNINI